jgi:hypothetical protein
VRGGGVAGCVGEKAQFGLFFVANGSIEDMIYFGLGNSGGGGGEGKLVLQAGAQKVFKLWVWRRAR